MATPEQAFNKPLETEKEPSQTQEIKDEYIALKNSGLEKVDENTAEDYTHQELLDKAREIVEAAHGVGENAPQMPAREKDTIEKTAEQLAQEAEGKMTQSGESDVNRGGLGQKISPEMQAIIDASTGDQ